ncbi:MAG TPA: DUF484 family protein [Candidatus Cybelea sp.]|nr:DUF484 family protein [Candidatus Cybelea sp.]
MTTSPEHELRSGSQPLNASQVIAYLRRHPGFLIEHPELLEVLTPPATSNGKTVVDMQRFVLERLQKELARLNDSQGALIAASRFNMATQTQIHAAVLAMLDATSFEHLIHTVTADFAEMLDVDVVTICVETSGGPLPRISTANVYVLPQGDVDKLIGHGRDILLRSATARSLAVYGPAADLVRSDALVRLRVNSFAPAGLLAIGSRQDDKFHPGQGTELLQFLARALERCIRAWLDLPPG